MSKHKHAQHHQPKPAAPEADALSGEMVEVTEEEARHLEAVAADEAATAAGWADAHAFEAELQRKAKL